VSESSDRPGSKAPPPKKDGAWRLIEEAIAEHEAEQKAIGAADVAEAKAATPEPSSDPDGYDAPAGPESPPLDRTFWMTRLAERIDRRAHLEELRAPESILADADELIRKAIAELAPADALAVVRASSEIAKRMGRDDDEVPPPSEEPS
jgi:hypothetical protein